MTFSYGSDERFAATVPEGAGAVTRAETAGMVFVSPVTYDEGQMKAMLQWLGTQPPQQQEQIKASMLEATKGMSDPAMAAQAGAQIIGSYMAAAQSDTPQAQPMPAPYVPAPEAPAAPLLAAAPAPQTFRPAENHIAAAQPTVLTRSNSAYARIADIDNEFGRTGVSAAAPGQGLPWRDMGDTLRAIAAMGQFTPQADLPTKGQAIGQARNA